MKSLISLIAISFSLVAFAAEEKKVCIDKKDAKGQAVMGKDGKPVQECKVIKVHKKLEGTPVPEKK